MREACIILPVTGSLAILEGVDRALFKHLCDRFGGCTVTDGSGGWITPEGVLQHEPVRVYTVAAGDDARRNLDLMQIAAFYGRDAKQHSMYWRSFEGDAYVDTLDQLEARIDTAKGYQEFKRAYGPQLLHNS